MGHQIFTFFKRSFFSSRVNLRQIEKQNYSARGCGGMLLGPKENLNTVFVVLMISEQFFSQNLFSSFALNSGYFTKYDVFGTHIFHLYVLIRHKDHCYQRFSKNMEKMYSS